MNIAGIDYSTKAIDLVTIPYDDDNAQLARFVATGKDWTNYTDQGDKRQPVWHTFPLEGDGAFDRARDVANALHGRSSAFWDDVLAVGIEHPGGKYGTGDMLRIQGAILSCLPARMLVQPLPPARWRKLVGLSGRANKRDIAWHSTDKINGIGGGDLTWPQDAHDAHLIALATRTLIRTPATV